MQTRRMSLVEALVNTGIGFFIAVASNAIVLPALGYPISTSENLLLSVIFTGISIVRGYCVRRGFNYLYVKGYLKR